MEGSASSVHDVKQHIPHEKLTRNTFIGAILLDYLHLMYSPNDCRSYAKMQILLVSFEKCDASREGEKKTLSPLTKNNVIYHQKTGDSSHMAFC